MRAAILSIGDELTLGQSLDTNSPWLAAQLAQRSILTVEHRAVADDRQAIANAIRQLAAICDVLILTGGLGPTDDDLTREALGDALTPGRELVFDEAISRTIEAYFAQRGDAMPANNRRQAFRPEHMRWLANPHGTAPGLMGQLGRCLIASLPGPPHEMQPMFHSHVLPALPSTHGTALHMAAVHAFGLSESEAARRLGDLMQRHRNPLVGITVSQGIISARIRYTGPTDHAAGQIAQAVEQVQRAWQPYAYGSDDQTLASVVGEMLRRSRQSLITAESCTGGWLGKALVDVAGSSDYYLGGWNTYSNPMKQSQLGVPAELLQRVGAVSSEVAQSMATGALHRSSADLAVAITGIAGPARADQPTVKPLGTVFISLAQRTNQEVSCRVRHFIFPGDRTAVRDRAVKAALQMLRFAMLHQPPEIDMLWQAPRTSSGSSDPSRVPAERMQSR